MPTPRRPASTRFPTAAPTPPRPPNQAQLAEMRQMNQLLDQYIRGPGAVPHQWCQFVIGKLRDKVRSKKFIIDMRERQLADLQQQYDDLQNRCYGLEQELHQLRAT